jgi:hypothetical protein
MVARPPGRSASWISSRREKSVRVVSRMADKMHSSSCFASRSDRKMYLQCFFEGFDDTNHALPAPGNLASDALGIVDPDSRMMLRTLVNMLVWNLVAVLAVLPFI